MTKVQFFLGDDTEPFTIKQPHQSREKRTANKNDIVKLRRKQKTCFNLLICFYGIFN